MPEASYTAPKVLGPTAVGVKVRGYVVELVQATPTTTQLVATVRIINLDSGDAEIGDDVRVVLTGTPAVTSLQTAIETAAAGEPGTGFWAKRNFRILKHLKTAGYVPDLNL